jgi:thiol-disulfide isomerase/thioredoxin
MTSFVKNLGSKLELVSKAAPSSSPGMSSSSSSSSLAVLHFWASWCEPCKAMDVVFAQLAADTPHAQFFRVQYYFKTMSFFFSSAVFFFLFFLFFFCCYDSHHGVTLCYITAVVVVCCGMC